MIPTPAELALTLSRSSELAILSKVTLVFVLGLAAERVARPARASVRHLLLAATFASALAIPIVIGAGVTFDVSVPAPVPVMGRPTSGVRAGALPTPATAKPVLAQSQISWWNFVRAMWIVGLVLALGSHGFALWRLRTLRRTGLPWTTLRPTVQSLAHHRGIDRAVEVLRHEQVRTPLTFATRHPVILLPSDAETWGDADLRRALVHELEHLTRHDWAVQAIARAICACYWFHPLAWVAWRRLSLDAERACDDAVVMSEESTEYAQQLVSLAERLSAASPQPMLGMANRSDLSARVSAVLDSRRPRGRAGNMAAVATACAAATVVAGLAPVRAVARYAAPILAEQSAKPTDAGRQGSIPATTRAMNAGLVKAAGDGNIDEVIELLNGGADVNAETPGDGSPLIAASKRGDMRIVRLLLERGADVNLPVGGDGNPLIAAAGGGHDDVVALLLERGAEIDRIVPGDENALIQASANGRMDTVKLLVSRGANVNARVWVPPIRFSRPGGLIFTQDGEWRTPLSMARRGGRTEVAQYLLSVGAID